MRAAPIALLIGLSLAAVPAAAQTAAAPAASTDTLWSAKPTGVYDLVAEVNGEPHNAVLGLTTDSTGTTKANVDSEGESHPMTVALTAPELVLTTDTPQGIMTLRLKRQGDKLIGTWARAMEGGKLEGTRRP
jgi:hypothetical protein